ncbi:MAG: hypothetical protein FWH14_04590 [Oscillospiraceae bacterium]|nr:hypothetical protein [Oscillospiraceae bacterium]
MPPLAVTKIHIFTGWYIGWIFVVNLPILTSPLQRKPLIIQHDNTPCRFFIYNSAKLSVVRQFATSSNIEIMIINIDAVFRRRWLS